MLLSFLYSLTLKLLKNVKFLYFPVPPDEVTILGPTEVKTDLTYVYRCEAKNANPAPKIQWIVNGIVTTTGVSTQTHPPPPRPSGFVPYDHPTGQSNKSVYSYLVVNRKTKYSADANVF
jgi:hypothetical protein